MNRNERNIQLIKDEDYETLLKENGGLVNKIVFTKLANKQEFDMDDMLSLGMCALYKAALTFDVNKGANFSTYASKVILNELLLHIRNTKKSVKAISIEELAHTNDKSNNLYIKDILSDNNVYNNTDYIVKTDIFYEMIEYAKENILTELERKVFDACIEGKKQADIAVKIGYKQAYSVSRTYRKACNKIKDYLLSKGVDQYFFN